MKTAATRTPLADEYVTRRELAAFLGKHVRTLDNWALRRFGPPRISVNGSHLYRRDAVRAWLNSLERN